MRDWLKEEPIVIRAGRGAVLTDHRGRRYLDANASIWTNLHGHNHPQINRAIEGQLKRISHSSALGLANEPAAQLAEQLVKRVSLARSPQPSRPTTTPLAPRRRQPVLKKVFFSDDGSTAMEAALKLHHQFIHRTRPQTTARYLSLENSYHGDTVGAMSLSHSPLFHKPFQTIRFSVDRVMAPYCYRCPFNRAQPSRGDARHYRQCQWECVDQIEQTVLRAKTRKKPFTAFIIEPLIQGAAGMIAHPRGYLARAEAILRRHGIQIIADEVLTGFGRTGSLIAAHQEGVQPDFLALAKGLTGGYLPMAATLTTQKVFDSFLGPYDSFRTFFHGHSFTGNQLGSAAALANLRILGTKQSLARRTKLEAWFEQALEPLWRLPLVGDIRRGGLVAGIELVQDRPTRSPFPLKNQVGIRVCQAMARRGVLTRSIGNVITILLIYTMTRKQVNRITQTLADAIEEVSSRPPGAEDS